MKILQVFDFLSLPHGGGTVDIVHKLSRALSKRGHEVTLCIGDYELDMDYLCKLGKVNVRISHSWFNKYGFYIMPSLIGFDIVKYDVAHLHCYRSFQNVAICCKAIKYKVPYIIDAHGSTAELPERKQLIRDLYDRFFGYTALKCASRVVAETEVGMSEYKKLGVDSDKRVLMHPLINTEEFDILPEVGLFREKHKINKPIVLFVGRINWAKGIETLVEAVSKLEDVCLVIVGQDDGFKSELEKLIVKRFMADRVLFTGFLSGLDKLSVLVDADVLVQPSKNEAGARPSLEAILCNTPVIVTKDTGAGKEISKFDAGYLFEYGNADMLSSAMQYILDNSSEVQTKTHKAKGYIKKNLSLDKQIVKYEELYEGVIT